MWTPTSLPESRRRELEALCQAAADMLRETTIAFDAQSAGPLGRADELGRRIHEAERSMAEQLQRELGATGTGSKPDPLAIPEHLEAIGEQIDSLAHSVAQLVRDRILITERARHELLELMTRAVDLLECVRDLLATGNQILLRHVVQEAAALSQQADDFADFHQQRLIEGICMPKASPVYLRMLDSLKSVEWHVREIARHVQSSVHDEPTRRFSVA